ncbi:MAG: DUF2203 domain-containing protein [Chloroflexi bacterium]|nr:DUF2203 domain-containing protein [Chloroflexota bacterium]
MPRRYFTVDDANALLPELTTLLQSMLEARQHMIDSRPNWEPIVDKARGNGGGAHGRALYHDTLTIYATLERMTEWGILIKDVDSGLVDFPHMRDGREVYLCWRLGEPRVAYWHDTDSDFAGRQPL